MLPEETVLRIVQPSSQGFSGFLKASINEKHRGWSSDKGPARYAYYQAAPRAHRTSAQRTAAIGTKASRVHTRRMGNDRGHFEG
jgi:hypothetical protein